MFEEDVRLTKRSSKYRIWDFQFFYLKIKDSNKERLTRKLAWNSSSPYAFFSASSWSFFHWLYSSCLFSPFTSSWQRDGRKWGRYMCRFLVCGQNRVRKSRCRFSLNAVRRVGLDRKPSSRSKCRKSVSSSLHHPRVALVKTVSHRSLLQTDYQGTPLGPQILLLTRWSVSPGAVDAVIASLAKYCHGEYKHNSVQFSFCLDLHWSLTCSFSCLLKQHHFTKSA